MKIRVGICVEIEWDSPEEPLWLCPENIKIALSAYCPNTKFEVREIEEPEEPCYHRSCEMVSGRKRDYLYCRDCDTNLSDDGE